MNDKMSEMKQVEKKRCGSVTKGKKGVKKGIVWRSLVVYKKKKINNMSASVATIKL